MWRSETALLIAQVLVAVSLSRSRSTRFAYVLRTFDGEPLRLFVAEIAANRHYTLFLTRPVHAHANTCKCKHRGQGGFFVGGNEEESICAVDDGCLELFVFFVLPFSVELFDGDD